MKLVFIGNFFFFFFFFFDLIPSRAVIDFDWFFLTLFYLQCVKSDAKARRLFFKKISITILLLIYPGLTVRIFQVFKCYRVQVSLEKSVYVLHQDFNVMCYKDQHTLYVTIAIGFLFLCKFRGRPEAGGRRPEECVWLLFWWFVCV